jgi:hypothetical protein
MLNPTILFEQAQLQHQEMLKQAETERLYRQLKGNQPGLIQQLRNRFKAALRQSRPGSAAAVPVYEGQCG